MQAQKPSEDEHKLSEVKAKWVELDFHSVFVENSFLHVFIIFQFLFIFPFSSPFLRLAQI